MPSSKTAHEAKLLSAASELLLLNLPTLFQLGPGNDFHLGGKTPWTDSDWRSSGGNFQHSALAQIAMQNRSAPSSKV